jgi:hypothetical protein
VAPCKAAAPVTAETANKGRASEHPAEGLRGKATTQQPASATLPVDRIRVGERHRLGDVGAMQQQVLDLASRLGADPKEIESAIRLMRTGRADLLIRVTAQRMTIRAALKAARSTVHNKEERAA